MKKENEFWKTRLGKWSTLDPPARISEGLFGLIMVLTFTGTISVSTAGRQEVRDLLWAALGCNLAWGLVDAIMYLMDVLTGRAHGVMLLGRIKQTHNPGKNRKLIRENISPFLSEMMEDEEIDRLGEKIKKLPELAARNSLTFKDFLIAGQIFLIVFLITLPVALPFLFVKDVAVGMRISNGIAVILLFAGGYSLARYSGLRPIATALAYVLIGLSLVILTMALGG